MRHGVEPLWLHKYNGAGLFIASRAVLHASANFDATSGLPTHLYNGTLIIEYRSFSFFCQVAGLLHRGATRLSSVFFRVCLNVVFLFCSRISLETNSPNLYFSFLAKPPSFRGNFSALRDNYIVPVGIVGVPVLLYGFSHMIWREGFDIFTFHNYSAGCSRQFDSSRFSFRTQKQSGIRLVVLEGF